MSEHEVVCRWLLVQAYCIWCIRQHRAAPMLSYARAVGLEPMWPLPAAVQQALMWDASPPGAEELP